MTPPSDPKFATTPSDPTFSFLAMCVECGDGIELPLPLDQRSFSFLLAQRGWFVTVLTPPNQGPEVPIVFGALCSPCAQKVYSPEVFAAGEQGRKQLLQASEVKGKESP